MSLILDALKKLEQEKAARQGRGIGSLGPAILKGGNRPVPDRRISPAVAAVAIMLLIGIVLFLLTTGWYRKSAGPAAGESLQPVPPTADMLPQQVPSPPRLTGVIEPETAVPPPPPRPDPQLSVPAAKTTVAASPPAGISVIGIAWQEERRDRRAVVNGLLVAEGATVAGHRVTEIAEDRVLFSSQGRTFAVEITSQFHGR